VLILIVFSKSYLSEYDSRLQKYFQSLASSDQNYYFIGWRRGRDANSSTRYFGRLYERPAALGGGFRNSLSLILWNIFILRSLFSLRAKISVVHAIDLDCAAACFVFARLFGKKFVFDIYDKYSAVRKMGRSLGRVADKLEQYLSRHSDLTIIAAEERRAQHRLLDYSGALLVLENVPGIEVDHVSGHPYRGKWRIGYFGVLEARHRGLEDLVELARCPKSGIELHIAGYGALEAEIAEAADRHANIFFYGAASSVRGLSIMQDMHVLAGLYYKSTPNHIHAAPNKYYEHLMLGRPLLTTCGTPPGHRVALHGTGWAVEEGPAPLKEWASGLDPSIVNAASFKARALWEERYSGYFERHYLKEYPALMKALGSERS
jgi:glycosyltransferase involved in cell wall biosynthesis